MELACRNCKFINEQKVCANCGSNDLSPKWEGEIIIYDVERSKVAKLINAKSKGRYAIEVK
ncbi:MAG: transcription elongation factor subunit Spt4 [Candidatus Rehaiarchaeum fermentans]|nr:hypothetical protein [Candidatus Rehaiarchaeum fermentans]MCW1292693.1 hypothetical protein [Candidatus Rehaiarchaeum fermentans]MCW1293291.1 hypothetical protein [Candidatus Rehaiarchaeum fermentans]MCW1293591.1 hypothetical protein [Candidatus Rehaiarchaeum fermentans]MCW1297597.1 hypothetical protein [Candidatus Rehaiarchaeum fermentans]